MRRARVLGVVLAGGASRRFGSDKALAELGGRTLLDRAVTTLSRQCDAVVVAGRTDMPGALADLPRAGMGPLGGLNAALHHGAGRGFDAVLSIPVDAFDVPVDLIGELAPAPAFAVDVPVIGLWPTSLFDALDAFLAEDTLHSLRAFAARVGARAVTLSRLPANINTPADLATVKDHVDGL
jgi:molybdopterin-guanine dinucleotide biosynthesis protein A